MSTVIIQPRECEFVKALSQCVRTFTERQLAEAYFHGDRANARKRLKRLDEVGIVQRLTVVARPVSRVDRLFDWQPGAPAPDVGALAYQLRSRWARLPARPTTAYVASRRGRALFGPQANGALKHAFQATHDLALAQVWLDLRRTEPELAARWRGEDLYAADFQGQKRPDALIVADDGTPELVIECAGGFGYDPPRLQAFHNYCAHTLRLPYRLYG